MYLPAPFRHDDDQAIFDLIESAPFATVVTPPARAQALEGSAEADMMVSHLPIALRRLGGGRAELRGHLARGNGHWRHFDGLRESLLIFHGPHAYVSPSWYDEPAAPPTWNYVVVHVHGRPRCIDSGAETVELLDELVGRYEQKPLALSATARRALERGIVGFELGFELGVDRVEAKFKLGQNKSPGDRGGTVAALESAGDVERELAAWTRRLTELA